MKFVIICHGFTNLKQTKVKEFWQLSTKSTPKEKTLNNIVTLNAIINNKIKMGEPNIA